MSFTAEVKDELSRIEPKRACCLKAELAALVRIEGTPVACAGLRRHDETAVELKRMFVRVAYRGRGLSRWLLARVEEEARALGYVRVLIETGLKQPEAMGLYESSGYEPIPGFGFYAGSPENRCYAKNL